MEPLGTGSGEPQLTFELQFHISGNRFLTCLLGAEHDYRTPGSDSQVGG